MVSIENPYLDPTTVMGRNQVREPWRRCRSHQRSTVVERSQRAANEENTCK